MKKDWKKIVGGVAPALATALGGPLAGMAVKVIAGKVLGTPEATEDEVSAAISGGNPEVLLKLKEADLEFKKTMVAAGVDLERIAAEDRNSARLREVSAHDSWTPRVLGGMVVAGFLMAVYSVLAGHVSELKDPIVAGFSGTVIGYLSAKADQVISYYFGSSASSSRKDKTISDIAKME